MDTEHQTDGLDKAIAAFVLVALGLSGLLGLIIGLTGGYRSPLIGLQFLSMFIPALAVLIIRPWFGSTRANWRRLPWPYIPLALLLLPVVMHVAMLPVILAYEGGLPWQDWLTPQSDGLIHSSTERAWGVMTSGGLLRRVALNAVVGMTVVSVLAVFEEVGWRAWLLPRLMQHRSGPRAVVMTSAIWAVWHVPLQLSGAQHVEGVSPVMLAVTMPFGIFAAGLVIGWLWLRTESIWIVSIAHGALNNWGQYALKYMRFNDAPDSVVGASGFIAVLAVGALLLSRYPGQVRLRATPTL
jgi:membrane protease YdiL (CAAX protease family)